MKLRNLELEGFGIFSTRRTFSFAPDGLSIVFGPNESGKSTLMEAILAAIFGFEKKEDEDSRRSWEASRSFAASLEFESGDALTKLFRDFNTNEVTVTRTEEGKTKELFRGDASARSRSEERRKYASLLQELFGFSDCGLARKTTFVGQLDIETELTPELRGLISGAGPADFQSAIETLEEKFEGITVENPWGPRKRSKNRQIENTSQELTQARERLGTSESFFKNGASLKADTARLEERKRTLEEKRDREKGFLEKLTGLVRLQESLKEAEKLLKSETKARQEQEKVRETVEKSRRSLSEDFRLFAGLSADIGPMLARAMKTEDELSAAQRKLSEFVVPVVAGRPVTARPGPRPAAIAALSAGVLAVFLLVGLLIRRPLLLGLAGVLVSAGAALLLVRYSRSRTSVVEKQAGPEDARAVQTIRDKIAGMEADRQRLREELVESFPDAERLLAAELGVRQISAEYEKYTDAGRRFVELEKGLPREDRGTAEDRYASALNSVAEIKLRIQKFVADAGELLALKDEPEKAAAAASAAAAESKRLENDLRQVDSELMDKRLSYSRLSATQVVPPEACEEEIDRLEKTLSGLLLRRDALKLAVETLRDCVRDYQANSVERLSGRISGLFAAVTGGRYTRVRLSEKLEPELEPGPGIAQGLQPRPDNVVPPGPHPLPDPGLVPEAGRVVSPYQLSTGALDQLYFCMRLAMIQELTGEKGLPLLLDDPFVNFDENRLGRVRDILLDLAGRNSLQIILFTHGERHLDWGAHVIRLDETT
jgi:energy-coupling factor transporter ATP-binding protein EcfA2